MHTCNVRAIFALVSRHASHGSCITYPQVLFTILPLGPRVVHDCTSIAGVPARYTIVMQIKIRWGRLSVAVDTYIWGLHGTDLQVLPTSIKNLRNTHERLSTFSAFFSTYRAPLLNLLKMAIARTIQQSRVLRGVNGENLGSRCCMHQVHYARKLQRRNRSVSS